MMSEKDRFFMSSRNEESKTRGILTICEEFETMNNEEIMEKVLFQ